MKGKRITKVFVAMAICLAFVMNGGCASTKGGTPLSDAETGSIGGTAMSTLLGQVIGRSTASAATGVGGSLGYITGKGADKQEAQASQAAGEQETWPLANTTWQVVSVSPAPAEPIQSEVGRFNQDGTLTTTTTYWDGRTVTDSESGRYRIVGRTLIINHGNYVINATFVLDGDSLYMDTGKYNLELQRM
jgi:hypothetical protein